MVADPLTPQAPNTRRAPTGIVVGAVTVPANPDGVGCRSATTPLIPSMVADM